MQTPIYDLLIFIKVKCKKLIGAPRKDALTGAKLPTRNSVKPMDLLYAQLGLH